MNTAADDLQELDAFKPAAAVLAALLIDRIRSYDIELCDHLPTTSPVRPMWTPGMTRLACLEEFLAHTRAALAFDLVDDDLRCDACRAPTQPARLRPAHLFVAPVTVIAQLCEVCRTLRAPEPAFDLVDAEQMVTTHVLRHLQAVWGGDQ